MFQLVVLQLSVLRDLQLLILRVPDLSPFRTGEWTVPIAGGGYSGSTLSPSL